VNERIDEEQATALSWIGFQVALDVNCGSLQEDLKHCAEHVECVLERASALVPADAEASEVAPFHPSRDVTWDRAEDQSCELWIAQEGTRA
jgi:hypothetical protein